MPQRPAERQKKYREKQLQKYGKEAIKEKESERKKEKRKANIELVWQKGRVRKQRSRQNAAKELLSSDSPAYKSTCSLGNAVKKAQSVWPNSPHKRAVIVKKLSLQFSTDSVDSKPKAGLTALPEKTKSPSINFFTRDDIFCHAPGKRDKIVLRSNGQKKTMQRRHLTMNISEVYQLFKMEYPNAAIRKSKFDNLRCTFIKSDTSKCLHLSKA